MSWFASGMATNPLAGKPAPASLLIDVAKLESDYYAKQPDVADANQLVSFGTSGHRGTPFAGTFTEAHILATTQAICEHRKAKGISGPLYIGKDSHAISAAFGLGKRAADVALIEFEAFALFDDGADGGQQGFECSHLDPARKTAMDRALTPKLRRKVLPFCPIIQNPEDAANLLALVSRRSAAFGTNRMLRAC